MTVTMKRVLMLTGDHPEIAKVVADDLGIDEWRAEVLPEDKLEVVRKLQDEGYIVGMVGDGINDAPALAAANIGIAIYPDYANGPEELLKKAEQAMYHAKEQGRNTFRFYLPRMNERAQKRLELDVSLRSALERDEFIVYYQPVFDLENGTVVGTEALLRWAHPTRGIIPPAGFIPLAEQTGLIVSLGDWVLREACRQNKAWQNEGLAPLRVAVNISAFQLQQKDLVESVAAVLQDSGLDPQWLELDPNDKKALVRSLPLREDIQIPVTEQLIVELYSK